MGSGCSRSARFPVVHFLVKVFGEGIWIRIDCVLSTACMAQCLIDLLYVTFKQRPAP